MKLSREADENKHTNESNCFIYTQSTADTEELSMLSVQLASRFLFNTGFHTKKNVRGAAGDWYDVLSTHLRHSPNIRLWFAHNVIFQHPHRWVCSG